MYEVGKEFTEGLKKLWKKQWEWKLVEMCEEDKLNGQNNGRTMGKLSGKGSKSKKNGNNCLNGWKTSGWGSGPESW